MSGALTPIVLTAAGLLVVSAVAKLRAPGGAARALAVAGLPVAPWGIRLLSLGELGLGLSGLIGSGPVPAAALAGAYAVFAGLALVLARRRSGCGCFGDSDVPASPAQSLLSATLAAACLGAAVQPAHDLGWVLTRSPATAVVLLAGIAGCVYAVVLAYTTLPAAWAAWSGR